MYFSQALVRLPEHFFYFTISIASAYYKFSISTNTTSSKSEKQEQQISNHHHHHCGCSAVFCSSLSFQVQLYLRCFCCVMIPSKEGRKILPASNAGTETLGKTFNSNFDLMKSTSGGRREGGSRFSVF